MYRSHPHPQPPNGRLHPVQKEEFEKVVQNNPSALPHQLQMGNAMPSSSGIHGPGQSVALIAPQLNNLGAVQYLRQKAITNSPGLISPKKSDGFITDYLTFLQECPQFVQHFQLDEEVQILSVQTPFIRALFTQPSYLEFSGDNTAIDDLPSIFQHGLILDAAHKFFHGGAKLLHTVSYFESLRHWQPIPVGSIQRANTETYASHFLTLFTTIASEMLSKNPDIQLSCFQKLISTVVDFSDAQRAGFVEGYFKFMTTTSYGNQLLMREWQLDTQYRFPSPDEHRSVAGSLLKGCEQHWKESISRISRNRHVIPEGKTAQFRALINEMFNASTMDKFDSTIEKIKSIFPNTADWLDWWAREEHAEMLFPVLSKSSTQKHLESISISIILTWN